MTPPAPGSPLSPPSPLSPAARTPDADADGRVFPTATLPRSLSDSAPPALAHAMSETDAALRSAQRLDAAQRKMRILVLSSDTGGGHRASAQALQAAIEQLHPGQVKIDIVDFWVDIAQGPFSDFPGQYAFAAKYPWLWKMSYEFTRFPPGRAFSEAFFNAFAYRKARDAFVEYAPDLIISVHPLVNTLSQKVLRDMQKQSGVPMVPYVTVVTDLGGAHPTWFHKSVDMTYVPSDGVRRVADRVGVPAVRIRQLGLPVRRQFWLPPRDKPELRAELGLRSGIPAILLIGGGDGVGGLKRIAETMAKSLAQQLGNDSVQLVVICGKNEQLRKWLAEKEWPLPLKALGYISNMSDYMAACDILCTKAGPGTIAEALIRGLPTILTGFLPGQEEGNVKYVLEHGIGEFASKPRKIANIATNWLRNPEALAAMSERARQCGTPDASMEIAKDILQVAEAKIAQNISNLDKQRLLREAQDRLQRTELQVIVPGLPYSQRLEHSSYDSHLVFRLQFLLRIVLGSLIAGKALNHTPRLLLTPPTSPVEAPLQDDAEASRV